MFLFFFLNFYFSIPENEKQKISMPSYRLKFIFLSKDRIPGKAKHAIRNQPYPILLNSYRGHLQGITSLVYINSSKILIR